MRRLKPEKLHGRPSMFTFMPSRPATIGLKDGVYLPTMRQERSRLRPGLRLLSGRRACPPTLN
jgi:hypothetical protein